mgnify:CR=1 FL=1
MMQYFDFDIYYYQIIVILIASSGIQDFIELIRIFLSIRYHPHFIFLPRCFHNFSMYVNGQIFISLHLTFMVIKIFHSWAIEIFRSNQMFNRIIKNQLISLEPIDCCFLVNSINCSSTTQSLFS